MAIFAKRHYEAIALVMQKSCPGEQEYQRPEWRAVREKLSDMFEQDNPQFNRIRFVLACNPGANVRKRAA